MKIITHRIKGFNTAEIPIDFKNFITFHSKNSPNPQSDYNHFSSIVEDRNFNLLAIPYNADRLLKIIPGIPPTIIEYFHTSINNKKGKWTSSIFSQVDKCVYCCPGTSGSILKIDPLYNISEFPFIEKTQISNQLEHKVHENNKPLSTGSNESLNNKRSMINQLVINKDIEFSEYFNKLNSQFNNNEKVYIEFPNIYNDKNYSIETNAGWDDECLFSKIISSDFTKSLFCIPWSGNTVTELFPIEHDPELIINNYEISLSKKLILFYDAVYNSKNRSIYCIPWESKELLQIIPRMGVPPLFKLFNIEKLNEFNPSFDTKSFKKYILDLYDNYPNKTKKLKKVFKLFEDKDEFDSVLLNIIDENEFNKKDISTNNYNRKINESFINDEELNKKIEKTKFSSGVLCHDKNVYLIPFNNDRVIRILINDINPLIDPILEVKELKDAEIYE